MKNFLHTPCCGCLIVLAWICFIIFVISLAFTPVDAANFGASWFRQSTEETVIYGDTWKVMQGNFDITQNGGLYNYSNGWFTTTYTGLVKLSGNCTNEKRNSITMRLFRQSTGFSGWHSLSEYSDEGIIVFFVVFKADNVQIQLWASNYAVVKCNLLFEEVK